MTTQIKGNHTHNTPTTMLAHNSQHSMENSSMENAGLVVSITIWLIYINI